MAKLYDVVAITGAYTDKEGREKKRYATLGAVIETKNGPMLKLETIPVTWEGIAYLNEPRPRTQAPTASPPMDERQNPAEAVFDDDIPF